MRKPDKLDMILVDFELGNRGFQATRKALIKHFDQPPAVAIEVVVAPTKTVSYGDPDVNAIVEHFKQTFGTTKATKQDRWAANRLAKKHGAEAVVSIITSLAVRSQEQYSPTVTSVAQLDDKWVAVIKFLGRGHTDVLEL